MWLAIPHCDSREHIPLVLLCLWVDSDCPGHIKEQQKHDDVGGIQWPYLGHEEDKERRLFENGEYYRPNKRALFCFEPLRDIPEPTSSSFPFVLMTGRGSASQWHTETRTSKSEILKKLYPKDTWVEINQ